MPIVASLSTALANLQASNSGPDSPYSLITAALSASPVLQSELNSDFSGTAPLLTSFQTTTYATGEGGYYKDNAIFLPVDSAGNLLDTNLYSLIFTIGHEQGHANDASSILSGDQTFQDGLNAPGADIDSLILANQNADATNEAQAQIAGFNALASAISQATGYTGAQLGAAIYAADKTDAAYFLNSDGTQLVGGPTVNLTDPSSPAVDNNANNVSAEANAFFYQPASPQNLGLFSNSNYPNFDGGYQLASALIAGGGNIAIDLGADNFNALLLAESLGGELPAGSYTVTDTGSDTTYTYVLSGPNNSVVSVQSGLPGAQGPASVFVGLQNQSPPTTPISLDISDANIDVAPSWNVNNSGSGATVQLGPSSVYTASGGGTNTVTASNLQVAGNIPSTVTVTGNAEIDNTFPMAGNQSVISVSTNGGDPGVGVSLSSGSAASLSLSSLGNNLVLGAGASALFDGNTTFVATGDGGTATLIDGPSQGAVSDSSTGLTFSVNGATLSTSGSSIFVNGNENTVSVDSDTSVSVSGNQSIIKLADGSVASSSGTANTFTTTLPVAPSANDYGMVAVSGAATVQSGLSSEGDAQLTLSGANVGATLGANSSLLVTQSGDQVNMLPGSNVDTSGGQPIQLSLTCGTTATGAPNQITISGSDPTSTTCSINPSTNVGNFTTDASGSAIAAAPGAQLTQNGSGDTDSAGAGASLTENGDNNQTAMLPGVDVTLNGTDDSTSGDGGTVLLASPVAQVNIGSTGTQAADAPGVDGGNITVAPDVNATISTFGADVTPSQGDNIVNAGADNSFDLYQPDTTVSGGEYGDYNISGDDDTIGGGYYGSYAIGGSNETLTAGNGATISVTGGYGNNITVGGNSNITLGGGGQNIVTLGGGGTVANTSPGNTINSNGGTVVLGTAGAGLTVNGVVGETTIGNATGTTGGSFTYNGSGGVIGTTGAAVTIGAGGTATDVIGGNDIVAGSGSSLTTVAGNDNVTMGVGGTLTTEGSGDVGVVSGANVVLAGNAIGFVLTGSDNNVQGGGYTGQTLTVTAGSTGNATHLVDGVLDLEPGARLVDSGSGNTYNVTGEGVSLTGGVSGTYNIEGANAAVTAGGYGTFEVDGVGATVNAGPYGFFTLNGDNATVTSQPTSGGATGGVYTVNGQGITVNTGKFATTYLNGNDATINQGNYGSVFLNNSSGSTISEGSDSSVWEGGYGTSSNNSNDNITLGSYGNATVLGSNNTVNLAGSYSSVDLSGNNNTATLGGIFNTVSVGPIFSSSSSGSATIIGADGSLNDEGIQIFSNGSDVSTTGTGGWYSLFGSDTTLNIADGGGLFSFIGSTGDTIDAPGSLSTALNFNSGSFSGMYGSDLLDWTTPTANGAYSTVVTMNPTGGESLQAQDFSGADGTGSLLSTTVNYTDGGSLIQSTGSYGAETSVSSQYSGADGSGLLQQQTIQTTGGYSQSTAFSYDSDNNYTGAQVEFYSPSGSQIGYESLDSQGQVIASSGQQEQYLGGTGGYSGYAGYDLSRATAGSGAIHQGQDISSIAAYDLSSGQLGAAGEADAAAYQAQVAQTEAGGTGVFSSGAGAVTWGAGPITWSFATGPGSASAPFSGTLGAQYQSMVERAFAAWGQATGLTFVEQSSPRNADIEVGWGDFDTAQSGVLGLTTTNASDGELQPGAEIRLEDPSDTALTLNSSGELSYSGTSATLYQVLLHEIGHAIGLGDSNDPSSVMYAVAGPTDASISSVDVGAVETLYRLTQAMSAMPSAGGASINEGAWVAPTPMLTPVAANAHAPHLMVA